ncbi:SAM-dependent methyltransferase, partial [Streptomyces sp. H28]|nr:SAM-dependent methyltransferase [Streptomyces sp. H28]
GRMLATLKPYAPPPPPGAQPPPLWGDENHVRELLGDRITDVTAERRTVVVDRLASPEEFRDFFKTRYGPVISVYASLADDPERAAALDRDLDGLGRRHDRGGEGAGMVLDWEYLLFTARRTV